MSKPPAPVKPTDRRSTAVTLVTGGVLVILGFWMLNEHGDRSRLPTREVTVLGTVGDSTSNSTWVGNPADAPHTWRQLSLSGIAFHDGARIPVQPARVDPDRLRADHLRSGRPLLDVVPEEVMGGFLLALGLAICLVVPVSTRRFGSLLLYLTLALPGGALLLRAAEIGFDLQDAHARGVLLPATVLGTAYAEDTDRRPTRGHRSQATPRALLAFTTPDHRVVVTTSAYRFRDANSKRGSTLAVRYRADDVRHTVIANDWFGPGLPLLMYGVPGVLLLGLWAAGGLRYLRVRRS